MAFDAQHLTLRYLFRDGYPSVRGKHPCNGFLLGFWVEVVELKKNRVVLTTLDTRVFQEVLPQLETIFVIHPSRVAGAAAKDGAQSPM